MKYLELNPVRAKITLDPAKYSYSSFGKWSEHDRHPYQNNIITHILPLIEEKINKDNSENENQDVTAMKELKTSMAIEMKSMIDRDYVKELLRKGKTAQALQLERELESQQKQHPQIMNFFPTKGFRGLIIGSDKYLRQQYRDWEIHQNLKNSA